MANNFLDDIDIDNELQNENISHGDIFLIHI